MNHQNQAFFNHHLDKYLPGETQHGFTTASGYSFHPCVLIHPQCSFTLDYQWGSSIWMFLETFEPPFILYAWPHWLLPVFQGWWREWKERKRNMPCRYVIFYHFKFSLKITTIRVDILAKSSNFSPSSNKNMPISSLFFLTNISANIHGIFQIFPFLT